MAADKKNDPVVTGVCVVLAAAAVFGGAGSKATVAATSGDKPAKAKAVAARPIPGGTQALKPVPYAALFRKEGREHGVSPLLLAAVAKAESDFRPRLVSHAGAQGLMQIMPGTARGLGVDPNKPAQAVDGAARLLARHQRNYGGDVGAMLCAYNAGQGRVPAYYRDPRGLSHLPRETQNYIPRVKKYMRQLATPMKEK